MLNWMKLLPAAALVTAFAVTPMLAKDAKRPVEADAEAKPASEDKVIAAWDKYQAAVKELNAVAAKIRAKELEGDAATEARNAAIAKRDATQKEFVELLRKADWASYAESNGDMLDMGLVLLGGELTEEHPEEAVKALEAHLKLRPDSQYGMWVKLHYLPAALLATGDLDRTIKRLNELIAGADEKLKPSLQVKVADIYAAKGDLEAAIKGYNEVAKALEGMKFERNDQRARALSDAKMRAGLVGKDAPNVDSKVWVGGEATSLAGMKGKVVVIDFWATWCGPCRSAMPGIDKIVNANKDKGVVAIGLTRFYANGFMPKDSSDLHKGESVKGITEETYVEHLTQFKKNSGISYPFVVGAAEDFKAYGVSGIPHIVIVNQQGKVAMVAVGSGNDALIKACVESLAANSDK